MGLVSSESVAAWWYGQRLLRECSCIVCVQKPSFSCVFVNGVGSACGNQVLSETAVTFNPASVLHYNYLAANAICIENNHKTGYDLHTEPRLQHLYQNNRRDSPLSFFGEKNNTLIVPYSLFRTKRSHFLHRLQGSD